MTETDFDKVIEHYKDALEELKKGEHDQLGTSLSEYSNGILLTIEEVTENLINGTIIIKERWK